MSDNPDKLIIFLPKGKVFEAVYAILIPTIAFVAALVINAPATVLAFFATFFFMLFGWPVVNLWYGDWLVKKKYKENVQTVQETESEA